ncbi:MAG: phosphate ABC transporter permease PstA [Gammaproteobacteria bacterium]|nr:phosphate ABC transporter permease PstA [Gammaproteobacteria bacterium]MCW8924570.1 phosphate ABC transporter permease PstA [Gammaproteobacteria bacterium]
MHNLDSTIQQKRDRRRMFADLRFRAYGIFGLLIAGSALLFLLVNIFSTGYDAFRQTVITMEFNIDADVLDVSAMPSTEELQEANTLKVAKNSFYALFPEVKKRKNKRSLYKLISLGAELDLRDHIRLQPESIGSTVTLTVPMSSDVDQYFKAGLNGEEIKSRLNEKQKAWLQTLVDNGQVTTRFNTDFFTHADSRYPELAGIGGAMVGTMYTLLICLLIAFPLGVAAAIYLEEFSRDTFLTRIIEANINNLAAVPSVIFGLLGLAVILNVFGLPRSTPLAGGIVLALMTLPTIIIACRSAIKTVPPSIREAGMAMGASPIQVIFHHVMPAAMSGTLTGTIIGLAQALGETAPLLMIGMVAFIANVPSMPNDPATALPVQIYLWAESAERGFVEKTAAAIMVIIVFLIAMNLLAVILRNRTRISNK